MKRLVLPLFACLAGLLAAQPLSATAESLGRLFTTPEQREALNRKRALNSLEIQDDAPEPTIKIDGQVQRSSGRRTTWVNGQAKNEADPHDGVLLYHTTKDYDRIIIESGEFPKTSVRVGETLNRGTQETNDLIGDGKITIHKAPGDARR